MVFANAVSDVAAAAVVALLVSFDSLNFEVQLQQEVKEKEEGIRCSNIKLNRYYHSTLSPRTRRDSR
jgi:hypothetical protein